MVTLNQIVNGIIEYADAEFVSKLHDWRKWVVGGAIGLAVGNAPQIFETLRSNAMVKALGVISEDNMVDIEKIYRIMAQQADKSDIVCDIPLLGAVTFKREDVDKLYTYISRR